MFTVDIVIVNYKTEHDLQRCLQSFREFGPKENFTLTVIDVETDEPYVRDFDLGRRVGCMENVGYAGAVNLAGLMTDGDVLALFNADTALISAGMVERCVAELMADPSWGILGPRQRTSAGKLTHAGIFGTNMKPLIRGWQEMDRGQYQEISTAVSVAGSAYFIKRACWDDLANCETFLEVAPTAVGAFLPTKHYYEETWCSYHARAHGWAVFYYGPETMIHEWHKASPLGGWAEQQMKTSQTFFREACDHHRILHD